MTWRKLGRILETDRWAQCPTPLVMDDRVRVYFSERDGGKSFIRWVDLALDDPSKILRESRGPVLCPGAPLAFDCDGQIPSFAIDNKNTVNLYYSGWLALPNGYHNATGIAFSTDGGETFFRPGDGPIMDRTLNEPYLAVTPSLSLDGRMFYISGLRWESVNGRMEPIYVIKSAVSKDGLNWYRDGQVVIPQAHPYECFSRPWVMQEGDLTHLYYCHRSAVDYRDGPNAYRIGHATSDGGKPFFRRDDQVGLDIGAVGDWDDKMVAYPAVFKAKGKTYMLFNGSGFGRTGFGLAVQE